MATENCVMTVKLKQNFLIHQWVQPRTVALFFSGRWDVLECGHLYDQRGISAPAEWQQMWEGEKW